MRQIGDRLHKAFVAPAGQLAEQKGEYNRDDNADRQVQIKISIFSFCRQ